MKWLNFWTIIWFIFAIALLVLVLAPKGSAPINPIDSYVNFLPGEPMAPLMDDTRCVRFLYMSTSIGTLLECTPVETDKNLKRIYVVGWDNQINSVQFTFKADRVVLGDIVSWYSRWNSCMRLRKQCYFFRWDKKTATAVGGWHGMATKINTLSFNS